MKIRNPGRNETVIERSDGSEVLYSYSTPVAAFVPGAGYLRTEEKFSVTTSRHANRYAGKDSRTIPHDDILAIADGNRDTMDRAVRDAMQAREVAK